MKRAPIRSAIFADAARRTDTASLAGALAMPGMVDVTCMADARPEHPKASATVAGVAVSTPPKHRPSDGGCVT
jgi:hypothetical protein